RRSVTREELEEHLHSLPDHPDWIPYRTSYYREQWGFCLRHRHREQLGPGNYEVVIDSTLAPGSLTYAECVIPGATQSEALTYKRSRRGNAATDRAAEYALPQISPRTRFMDFEPYGYDERQFCSPGFDLPIGRVTRSPNGQYAEYHTSGDDLGFIRREALAES